MTTKFENALELAHWVKNNPGKNVNITDKSTLSTTTVTPTLKLKRFDEENIAIVTVPMMAINGIEGETAIAMSHAWEKTSGLRPNYSVSI